MPTIIATPGLNTSNAYCDLAFSDAYHELHLYASAWIDEGDDDRKIAALIWATRLLDEQVGWAGYKLTDEQALRWPRYDVYDQDGYVLASDSIPLFLKNATAELARTLLAENRTTDRSFGITSVKADTVEVVFDKQDVKPVFPASVLAMVAPYGTVKGSASGTIKLVRA
jgi:hypothetical protein